MGLSFDPANRRISGRPEFLDSENGVITVTATSSQGSASYTYEWRLRTPTALREPSFPSPRITRSWWRSIKIVPYAVPRAGGVPDPTYTATGLPAGLSFDSLTRQITGTPTTNGTGTSTIAARNSEGSSEFTIDWTVASARLTAVAGADQRVKAADVVVLDGTCSSPGDHAIRSFAWAVVTGSATLVRPNEATAYFLAAHSFTGSTVRVRLTVTDDAGNADSAEAEITILARSPRQPQTGKGPSTVIPKRSRSYAYCVNERSYGPPWDNRPGRVFTWSNATEALADDDRQEDIDKALSDVHLLFCESALLKWTDIGNFRFLKRADAEDVNLRFGYQTNFLLEDTVGRANGSLKPLTDGVFIGFRESRFDDLRLTLPEHEIGHFLGLLHPPDAQQIMFGVVSTDTDKQPANGDTIGTWHLYGPADNAPNVGPDVVQSFSVTAGVRRNDLSWSAPLITGGSAITGYRVFRGNADNWGVVTGTTTGTTYAHTGLGDGETLWYWVVAQNAQGDGIATKEVKVITLAAPMFPAVGGTAQSWAEGVSIATLEAPKATGGPEPTYSATGLPVGIAFEATTRQISGRPKMPGSGIIIITATNSQGSDDYRYAWTLTPATATPGRPIKLRMVKRAGNAISVAVDHGKGVRRRVFAGGIPLMTT